MRKRVILAIGLAAALAVPVGLAGEDAADSRQRKAKVVSAKTFRSCSGLTRYARRHALNTVEPGRLVSFAPRVAPLGSPMPMAQMGPEGGARALPAPATPVADHSPTNVQEAGVDEPDIVKTDGSRIFAVAAGKLHAVDAAGGTPRLIGSLPLDGGSDHQLLLHGDRLLVISGSYGGIEPLAVRGSSIRPGASGTILTEVDVRDPGAMRVVRTLEVDGTHVSSRSSGGTARVVIASHPEVLDPVLADPAPLGAVPGVPVPVTVSDSASRGQTRSRIRRSTSARWLPSYVLHDRRTGRKVRRGLVPCRAVRRAAAFSGLDLLSVLTIDLRKGLPAVDTDALMTDAQIVYASPRNLYVATQRWLAPDVANGDAGTTSTTIHKFAAVDSDSTAYRASGKVPGILLNQFSLSEHKGFLRVASTEQPTWMGTAPRRESESFVTVLEERSGSLDLVGRVGGLGHGERIYSVRFIDDVGFVVTFRQTDPLYTIDLSTPAKPKVLGELKILGYSAYLHPVGDDLLVGVGQDATRDGRTLGTQISLFDVSDLRRPARLHQRTIAPGSHSEVEYDHHAFVYWPPAKLAVMPLQVYGGTTRAQEFSGAIGFRIARAGGIDEAGRISHDAGQFGPPVRRALVVGGRLFTVSEQGVKASSLDTLAEQAWVPFG